MRQLIGIVATVLLLAAVHPASAAAHGPVDPPASSYLAQIRGRPPGVRGQIIDGDQRMWIDVVPGRVVTVLDYLGAPYLRIARGQISINENSEMWYLNMTPPQTPPPGTGASTPPHWVPLTGGWAVSWHDGRLHALAATALPVGPGNLGRWRIPLLVDGRPAQITGRLLYAPSPSIVWFEPILVALGAVAALLRVRRTDLLERAGRGLGALALLGFAVAVAGQQLHGRPTVSLGQLVILALALSFAAWLSVRLVRRRSDWFTFFLIAAAAVWEGATLISVLLDGFVLIALPAPVARAAVALCLSAGVGLLPIVFALAERPGRTRAARPPGAVAT
jgi:hypothetical protein